jgi:hypothetical protein
MKLTIINILIFFSFTSFCQILPTYNSKVAVHDKINHQKDIEFGVGDDGINNMIEPMMNASSYLNGKKYSFPASNINDYNLETPWISSNKTKVKADIVEFTYDYSKNTQSGNAISINSFYIINGYRNYKLWKHYSRIKKLKMFINNMPIAYIELKDTYKFQSVDFPDYLLSFGKIWRIKFEIIEVFKGGKYKNTAISEFNFSGNHGE